MPSGTPVHPAFVRAVRKLVLKDLAHADVWRALEPTARRLGLPRPSYGTVRLLARSHKWSARAERAERDRLVEDVLVGRIRRPS